MSSPSESTASSPAPSGAGTPVNQIDLPLTEVIKKVPDRLKSFIAKIPGEADVASFAASQLMPQLAKGSVKITFAELIEASPEGTFSNSLSGEDELIELPLALVISRLGTGSFQRRPAKQARSVAPQDFFGANRPAAPPAPETPAPIAPQPAAAAPAFTPTFPDGMVEPSPKSETPKSEPATPTFSPSPPAAPAEEEPAPAEPPDKAAISLDGIVKILPAELSACLSGAAPAGATVEFSAAALLPQLAKGKVSVTFAELVEAAPEGLFTNTAGHEQTPVALPLGEVLSKVGPGAFKRKAPTKQLAPAAPQKYFGGLAKPMEGEAPLGEAASLPTANFQPAAPKSAPAKKPLFAPTAGGMTFQPEPAAPPGPSAPRAEPAGQKFEPQPVAPEPVPAAATSGAAAAEVPVLLSDLTAKFPDGLKAEIAKLPEESVILFPAEELGLAMKSAKIRFTWTQLRQWMRPKSNYASAAWEGTQVELPLKAVVGPFMAAMRGQPPKVRIPASLGPFPAPASPSPVAASPASAYKPEPFVPSKPAAPVRPTPPPMDGAVGGSRAPATPPPDASGTALGELLGQPAKSAWTPVEIVQHVGHLEGAGGAMLSLSEGQIAAAAINLDVKTELVAFRVPRLLNLVSEHVEQMQLESPTSVSFSTGGVQWISFKLGNIFFTVHGRKGENLPVTQLEAIAAEVARRK